MTDIILGNIRENYSRMEFIAFIFANLSNIG